MPNYKKDIDLDRDLNSDPTENRGSDKNSQFNRNRNTKDSLDNFNENVARRAVGAIFENIRNEEDAQFAEIDIDNEYLENVTMNNPYNTNMDTMGTLGTINTDFSINSATQRNRALNNLFSDEKDAPKRKPKNARPTRLGEGSPSPINSKKQLTNNNSAYTGDDDTLYNKKYVTRGNHMPITPAMNAQRKEKTMLESQRIPTITDEDIAAYKSNITFANATSYNTGAVPKPNQYINQSLTKAPRPSDDYEKYATRDQKELIDHFKHEREEKDRNLEDTMYRLNEKSKYYQEIIASNNKKYKNTATSDVSNDDFTLPTSSPQEAKKPVFVKENTDFNNNDYNTNSFDNSFDNNFDEDSANIYDTLNITGDDLDQDFEDTVASNYTYQEKTTRQTRPLIPTNDLSESKPKTRRGNDSLIKNQETGNFYDLETDTFVEEKVAEDTENTENIENTGEVQTLYGTEVKEISISDLDSLVFKNTSDEDITYLKQTLKETSHQLRMQDFDDNLNDFEKKHRNFNKNVPPKTRPKTTKRPEPRSTANDRAGANQEDLDNEYTSDHKGMSNTQRQRLRATDSDYNSYEYRKAQTAKHSTVNEDEYQDYDTDNGLGKYNTSHNTNHNTGRYNTNHNTNHNTGRYNTSHNTNHNTGRYNTNHDDARYNTSAGRIPPTHTSRISTVNFHQEDEEDYEDNTGRLNASLIFNVLLFISLIALGIFTFSKVTSLSNEVEALSTANAELVEKNNKINELQIDVDYYKNLYQNTEEGKAQLEAEQKAEGETSSTETSSTTEAPAASGKTYTVVDGDTLSSISKKVYGDSNQYQKIIDANKLTSDSVSIGQVLIIP